MRQIQRLVTFLFEQLCHSSRQRDVAAACHFYDIVCDILPSHSIQAVHYHSRERGGNNCAVFSVHHICLYNRRHGRWKGAFDNALSQLENRVRDRLQSFILIRFSNSVKKRVPVHHVLRCNVRCTNLKNLHTFVLQLVLSETSKTIVYGVLVFVPFAIIAAVQAVVAFDKYRHIRSAVSSVGNATLTQAERTYTEIYTDNLHVQACTKTQHISGRTQFSGKTGFRTKPSLNIII